MRSIGPQKNFRQHSSFLDKLSTTTRNVHTIVVVVAHHHLLDLSVLAHLAPEVLVEGIEVVLELGGVHLVLRVVGGVLVEVGQ